MWTQPWQSWLHLSRGREIGLNHSCILSQTQRDNYRWKKKDTLHKNIAAMTLGIDYCIFHDVVDYIQLPGTLIKCDWFYIGHISL